MAIADQIKALENLTGSALREKFVELVGLRTRSNNRPYLVRRIAHALQERGEAAHGPARPTTPPTFPSRPIVTTPPSTTEPPPAGRDPRIPPPGTVLERKHKGRTIRATVLEDGFEFEGRTYRSLSAIALEATGTAWNGLLFFRLIPYAKRGRKRT